MRNRLFPDVGISPAELSSLLVPDGIDAVRPAPPGPGLVNERAYVRRLDSGATAYVPEFYEANYPYPLIVWLPSETDSTARFSERMQALSPRNCLGLQLPGVEDESGVEGLLEGIRTHVSRLRRAWHVHTERIFLAGLDNSAEAALLAFLARPQWFGGAIALKGAFGTALRPHIPFRNPALRGKRLFLAAQTGDGVNAMVEAGRLLGLFGLDVTTRGYDGAAGTTAGVMADVNVWLMDGVCVPA